MMNSDLTLLYDAKNQRFLKHASNTISTLASPEGSAFELNNVGKTMIYGAVSNNDFLNCLMKDNAANNYFVYRVNTSSAIMAAEIHPCWMLPGWSGLRYSLLPKPIFSSTMR